jgi:hypothetical protein
MTTAAKLLARKQQLLQRLQEDPGPNEREEIERILEQIDTALNQLEEIGPDLPGDQDRGSWRSANACRPTGGDIPAYVRELGPVGLR